MKKEIEDISSQLSACRGNFAFINFVSKNYAVSTEFATFIRDVMKNRKDVKVVDLNSYLHSNAFEYYNVSSYPYVMFIDKSGEITRVLREEKNADKLFELLRS